VLIKHTIQKVPMPSEKYRDLRSVFELHQAMEENQVILAYEGNFSPHITQSVLSLAEQNLDRNVTVNQTKRRAFNIAVECLQNISTHSNPNARNSIFIIGKDGDEFYISSGNMIKASKVQDLRRKLDQINNLDAVGLKQLHMQAIKESLNRKDTNNAGLGLISIARKSGNKLDYEFINIDNENSFFSFQASFDSDKETL